MASRAGGRLRRFGVFELDVDSGELRKGGVLIRLQEKPLRVLATLLERPGEVVSKEELADRVWADATVELDLALSTAVGKIRRVLGDSASNPRFIETLPKRGYRFLESQEAPLVPLQAVAVLPFLDLSKTRDNEHFSDGLTDVLITELAKVGSLKVISRTSVMSYKGSRKSAADIAAELKVSAIVEGSVQLADDQIRVTAQLIDAEKDDHIWAETYDRPLESVLALQGEIARDVAGKIQVSLTPRDLARFGRQPSVNVGAFEAYLRGKHHADRFTPDGLRSALSYFQSSLDVDPNSSLAHSGLAWVYFMSTIVTMRHPREAGRLGYAEAKRAVELDPESAQAYVCLALHEMFFRWDWSEAEAAFLRAIALSPNNAEARVWFGMLSTALGREAAGEGYVHQALELDPLNLMNHHMAGVNCVWSQQYEEAVDRLRGVVARAPGMQLAHKTIWCALHALGRRDEAFEAAVEAWASVGDQQMVQALRDGHEEAGYRGAMLRGGDTLAVRFDRTYVPIYITAMHYDFGGDVEKALDWMERGYRERDHAMVYLHRKPFSQELKAHPRFCALMRRLKTVFEPPATEV